MSASLEITGMTKIFDTPTGPYIAVQNVNAMMKDGVRQKPDVAALTPYYQDLIAEFFPPKLAW